MEETFSKEKDPNFYIEIVTPRDIAQRGCQLSVRVSVPVTNLKKELDKRGVVVSISLETRACILC